MGGEGRELGPGGEGRELGPGGEGTASNEEE